MNDANLPTSFRLKKKVLNHLELMRKAPRKHGFHPSGLPRMCPVKFALYDRAYHNLGSSDSVVLAEAMVMMRKILDGVHDGVSPNRLPSHLEPDFHVGDAIHEFVQYTLGLRGLLWGRWECPWCRTTTGEGFMPTVQGLDIDGKSLSYPAPCLNCAGQNLKQKQIRWNYVEPWVGDDAWGITGHADGILVIQYKGQTIVCILEIKSINMNGYTGKYGEPLPRNDHVIQASQYVACVRGLGDWLSDVRHVYFIYVNKNAVREWKEFLIPANMAVVAHNQAKMTTIIEARKSGVLPIAHRVCQSVDDVTARKCPCVAECMGREPEPIQLFATLPAGAVDVPL